VRPWGWSGIQSGGGAVADWAPGAMDSAGDFAGDAFSAISDFFG
jgi:hypothetical protein